MEKETIRNHRSLQLKPDGKEGFFKSPSPWQVLESLGESAAIVDRRFRIIWINEPLLSHLRPQVDPIGQPCYRALFHRNTPCVQNCPVKPVLADGKPCRVERKIIGPDGVEKWREARAYPIMDQRGQVCYIARISFDITALKREESRHKQAYERLNRSLTMLHQLQVEQLPFASALSTLTRREVEILRLITRGYSKPRIADDLGISLHTVKAHVVHIFNKLGVNDRAQAAVWAARQGIV